MFSRSDLWHEQLQFGQRFQTLSLLAQLLTAFDYLKYISRIAYKSLLSPQQILKVLIITLIRETQLKVDIAVIVETLLTKLFFKTYRYITCIYKLL